MKYQYLGKSDLNVSRIALGLMRLNSKTVSEAKEIIKTALEVGINFFDHADIYGKGECEVIFGKAMSELKIPRESFYIQSKVGIKPGISYDFSKEHILKSVDEILTRLNTSYLDSLLLHRPDLLWEPEEIRDAFIILKENGKVRNFGVSNMNQFQISYLQKHLPFPIIANQLQFSVMHNDLVSNVIFTNTNLRDKGLNTIGLIDYLREHEITIQAWSPFQYGFFEGVFVDNPKFKELNDVLEELAEKYAITKTGIAVSFIATHPANIQTVIGTMNTKRIKECAAGVDVKLTKDDWYKILLASGSKLI